MNQHLHFFTCRSGPTYHNICRLSNEPQPVFELVYRADRVPSTVHVDQCRNILPRAVNDRLRVEQPNRNSAMWPSNCSEFDLANRCLLILGKIVPAKKLKVMPAFLVKVYIAA